MRRIKEEKAMTLVALVVTIIVLIILAGITLNLLLGENGLIKKTLQAKTNYEDAKDKELADLDSLFSQIQIGSDSQVTLSTEQLDEYITRKMNEKLAQYATKTELNNKADISEISPIGTIIAYSVDSVPTGYLACNGQSISRTEYPELFAIIGTTYGAENDSTFKVPDLRGEFLRGTGTATRNTGTGAAVGAHQDPTEHPYMGVNTTTTYTLWTNSNSKSSSDSSIKGIQPLNTDKNKSGASASTTGLQLATNSMSTTWAGAAGRTNYTSRPTNTSVLYCIKAK